MESRKDRVATTKQVLVWVNAPLASGRSIALGIARFAEEHGGWDITIGDQDMQASRLAKSVQISDGAILASPNNLQLRNAAQFHKPLVAILTEVPFVGRVMTDDENIGRTAFAHLRSLGLTQFATVGFRNVPFSTRRLNGFHEAAQRFNARRYNGLVYETLRADPHEYEPFVAFLKSLPRPCGVFAVSGMLASVVIREAKLCGIAVPEDMAVVGVTSGDVSCELSRPRITTVDDRVSDLGYEAARMLDRMFKGEAQSASKSPVVVPCGGVVVRGSSDVLSIDDPDVRSAVELIRREALGKLRVADVLERVSVSRRKLERAFIRKLGRSMHDEILRVRLEEVRRMLKNTDHPMKQIASACGFSDVSKLSTTFRKAMGMSPREFRRQTSFVGTEPSLPVGTGDEQPAPPRPGRRGPR